MNLLANRYTTVGPFELAVIEGNKAIDLNPKDARPYVNVAVAYIELNRFDEAKEILRKAEELKLESANMHARLYQLGFLDGDSSLMKEQLDWANANRNPEAALNWQAQVAGFQGRLAQADQLNNRAVDMLRSSDAKETMAQVMLIEATRNATLNNCGHATQLAKQALELSLRGGRPGRARALKAGRTVGGHGAGTYTLAFPPRRTCGVQEMVIYGVSFDMVGKQPIVLLKTVDGNKFLPIWIGHPEAASILMKLQGAGTPRPMTHDLLCDILGELEVKCTQVSVTELRENTFFASITLSVAGREMEIDSRPSDAIALAVRSGAPIYAAEEVIAESAIEFEHDVEESEDVVERFKEFLDEVSPEDFAAGDS